jgi:ADP-heptose:LPS heptosyltransferase
MSARDVATLPDDVLRVLVLELAGLGDNVHLLPALWLVRRRWPNAKLHVLTPAPVAALFELTPWVDHVWSYPMNPKPGLTDSLRWARRLRTARFDAAIDVKATDRSSLLAFATRAPLRIGRRPADSGPPGWRMMFTRVAATPYYTEPMYVQKWRCLEQLGFAEPGGEPEFHVAIDPRLRRTAGIDADAEGRYLHVSPCTTSPARELPSPQLAQLIDRICAAHPGLRVAFSCADTAREKGKLAEVASLLTSPPWKTFAGTLDIATLAAVIETAALHLSGDTGSLHLAMMTRTPALAWFRHHKGEKEWIPAGPQYRVLIGPDIDPRDAVQGIADDALFDAARAILAQVGR